MCYYHIHLVFSPYNSSCIPLAHMFPNFVFLFLKTIYPTKSNYCFPHGWKIIIWNMTNLILVTTTKKDDYLPSFFYELPIAPQLQMNLMSFSPSLWEFVLPE